MTNIRVAAPSVRAYGQQATDVFGGMHTSLSTLVDQVVNVHYVGPNADDFKAKCGQIATDFATQMHKDMVSMAEVVRVSTSNIASSLGGAPISIAIDSKPFVASAATKSDAEVTDVETAGLEQLTPLVTQRFAELREALSTHLTALQGTDWQGSSKEAAVGAVSKYTTSAQANCDTTEKSITTFISNQLKSVLDADRPVAI